MKIILAGMPKTGTHSIKAALVALGYSVFDCKDNFERLHDPWTRIMTQGGTPDDFRDMYCDVDATCDVPACHYWEEMHAAFPDAKIVLMVRESEREWWLSMDKQLRMLANCGLYSTVSRLSPHCGRLQRFLNNAIRVKFGVQPISPWRSYSPNEQLMKIAYRNHNARVLQVAPRDKLLVFKCSEGWRPLCEFLGCQPPDQPFPHLNQHAEATGEEKMRGNPGYQNIKREITVSICALVCGVGYLAYNIMTSPFLIV